MIPKNIFKTFKSCLAALLIVSALSLPSYAKAEAMTFSAKPNKVGLIDMIYVYENSETIRSSNEKLAKQNIKIQKLVATANQEIGELREKAPESVDKKQQEIQAIIDKEVQAFYKLQKEASSVIEAKVQTLIESFARDKSLELILDKTFVTSGGIDLTNEFLKKLDAKTKK